MTGTLSMFGTFSKAPRAWGFEDGIRAVEGDLANVLLSDGRTYLDWVCGLGSNLLGYNNSSFVEKIVPQISKGTGFSLPHYIEDVVAEKLVDLLSANVPYWKNSRDRLSVRFAKTGSEANSAAVRLARAFTGKDVILHCGYGGWGVEFISADPPAHGIPLNYKRDIRKFSFNESIEKHATRHDIAAVMLEQGIVEPEDDWYEHLRDFCDDMSALLIIDEVVTGLRYSLGGATAVYNIKPDIMTMGKGLGNGFAVSAIVADKNIMSWFSGTSPAFCSSTHWGEAASLFAANAMLDLWTQDKVDHIYKIGNDLIEGIKESGWSISGHAPRSVMTFSDSYERAFFVHGMRANGILMNRPNFVSFAHSDLDVKYTVNSAKMLRKEYLEVKDILQTLIPKYKIPHVLFSGR